MAANNNDLGQIGLSQAITIEKDFETSEAFVLEFGRWITAKGMLVPMRKEVPAGTPISFRYTLQARRDILNGSGKVLWFKEGAGQRPSGIGIGFVNLTDRSKKNIDMIVKWKGKKGYT